MFNKLKEFPIIIYSLFVIILILGFLLYNRKIWFVYPDKNICANVFNGDISELKGLIMK